jgi:hypothetical protein
MKARRLILTIAAMALLTAPAAVASDVTTVIRTVAPLEGKYEVEFENTSRLGYITSVSFVPPAQMKITAVTATTGGKCRIDDNVIRCFAAKKGIAPPRCACRAGGSLIVDFTAKGNLPTFNGKYWQYYGIGGETHVTSMMPVAYYIPLVPGPGADAPLCEPGTQPTQAHPCVVE